MGKAGDGWKEGARMKLSVPTNWQDDLLETLDTRYIGRLYGKLKKDFVGGGRPSFCLPSVSKKAAVRHIAKIHAKQMKFYYLLNVTCMANSEWTMAGQRQLHRLFSWLTEAGVDGVVLSIPYLADFIRHHYPHLEIAVSIFANVNSVEKAQFWERLGATVIVLPHVEVNRDFALLRSIRRHVKCGLEVLVNDGCISDCPTFYYHNNMVSHSSKSVKERFRLLFDYCFINCRYRVLQDPANSMKIVWIRPEDVAIYEKMGIDSFKIAGRTMLSKAICTIVSAYSERRYEGNLMDLWAQPSNNFVLKEYSFFYRFRNAFHPLVANPFRLIKLKNLLRDMQIYIDNTKLDGFIETIGQVDCRTRSCDTCTICKDRAAEAIRMDEGWRKNKMREYEEFMMSIKNGNMFKYL